MIQEAFRGDNSHRGDRRPTGGRGWYAIAPAFFHRQGSARPDAYDDLDSVDADHGRVDCRGPGRRSMAPLPSITLVHAGGLARSRIGVVGFCMGGSVTLLRRHHPGGGGAAVTFYGGGVGQGRFGLPSLIELAPSLKTPWLGLYGDLDKGIPTEEVEQLRDAVSRASVPTEIMRFADADHGFNCG